MMRFACPACKTVLQVPAERAGTVVACPRCQKRLQAPAIPPAVVPVAAPAAPIATPIAAPVAAARPAAPIAPVAAPVQAAPASAVTVAESEMDFATLPAGPPSTPSRRRPAPRPSIIKRVLNEFREVGSATYEHSTHSLSVLHRSWGGGSLRQASEIARLNFGQRLYDQRLGEPALLKEIHDLGEQIHRVTTAQGKPGLMIDQRQQALLRLADQFLARPEPPPGLDAEYHKAHAAQARFLKHKGRVDAERAGLPTAPGTRRRLVFGYGFVAATALLFVGLVGLGLAMLNTGPDPGNKPPPPIVQAPKVKRPEMPRHEVVRVAGKSVALIRGKHGFGTGFVVRPDILATNAHVIDYSPINELEVLFPSAGEEGKRPRKVQALLYEDKKRDLAFLRVANPYTPLEIADEYEFLSGHTITIIGNPGAGDAPLENAVSGGTLSIQHQIDGQDFFQMDIGVNPGNSGGPVFDSTGQVIGVVTLKQRADRIAYCVPWGDLAYGLSQALGQTRDEVAANTAKHDLAAQFVRIVLAGRDCCEMLADISYRIEAATKGRRDPVKAAGADFDVHQENLKRIEGDLQGVSSAMVLIGRDSRIPEELRAEMADFWANYQALRKLLTTKIDSSARLALFETQSEEQVEKFLVQVRKLAIKLGFNDRRLGL